MDEDAVGADEDSLASIDDHRGGDKLDQDEHKLRVWEAERTRLSATFNTHSATITGFSSMAINGIILANGAAAAGVLAFLGNMWGEKKISPVWESAINSVEIFALGAFAAILSASVSYIAQFCYATADFKLEKESHKKVANGIAIGFHILAVLSAATGMLTFLFGALEGVEALRAAKGGLTD